MTATLLNAALQPHDGVASARSPAASRSVFDRGVFMRGLTPRRLLGAAIVIAAFTMWSTVANVIVETGGDVPPSTWLRYALNYVPQYAYWVLPALLAVAYADSLALTGRRKIVAIVAALIVAGTVAPTIEYFLDCADGCDFRTFAARASRFVFRTVEVTVYMSAIALAYFSHRRERTVAAALHASEMERVATERARLQAKLQTMQARVEPAFLLGALDDLDALYSRDRTAGGRMLDLLIQYLRSALPQMREADSTLAREATLLRSYLGILALRSDGALDVACQFEPDLAAVRMPPMVLVPLAAAACRGACGTLRADAYAIGDRVRVTMLATGAAPGDATFEVTQDDVAGRVTALYERRASFVVDRPAKGHLRIILEIPDERADSGHR